MLDISKKAMPPVKMLTIERAMVTIKRRLLSEMSEIRLIRFSTIPPSAQIDLLSRISVVLNLRIGRKPSLSFIRQNPLFIEVI